MTRTSSKSAPLSLSSLSESISGALFLRFDIIFSVLWTNSQMAKISISYPRILRVKVSHSASVSANVVSEITECNHTM